MSVECPICGLKTSEAIVNVHLDRGCPEAKKVKREPSGASGAVPSGRNTVGQPAGGLAKSSGPTSPTNNSSQTSQASNSSQITLEKGKQSGSRPQPDDRRIPLAERMRPKSLTDYVGQPQLLGDKGVLRQLLLMDKLPSLILWGPAGVGKTTFARLLAQVSKARFVELSATTATVTDAKRVIDEARNELRLLNRKTVLFLDEIHRFNRTQQDSLLPGIERGDITLVGATTENPSFKLQGALLSRCRVFILEPLTHENLVELINRALAAEHAELEQAVIGFIADSANGDGRAALNMLEIVLSLPEKSLEAVKPALKHAMLYDQKGDMHYDLISAFHKSVRGSDADAALYYLARMLEAGEDPLYVARRMIRIASEDVGLADDSCLPFAVAAHTAAQQIGMPEADVILAHCAVKLARAQKSVDVYKAYKRLAGELRADPTLAGAAVPIHLRNAPTKLMEDIGYGKEYKYNPDYVGSVTQEYLPRGLEARRWLGTHVPTLSEDSGN